MISMLCPSQYNFRGFPGLNHDVIVISLSLSMLDVLCSVWGGRGWGGFTGSGLPPIRLGSPQYWWGVSLHLMYTCVTSAARNIILFHHLSCCRFWVKGALWKVLLVWSSVWNERLFKQTERSTGQMSMVCYRHGRFVSLVQAQQTLKAK